MSIARRLALALVLALGCGGPAWTVTGIDAPAGSDVAELPPGDAAADADGSVDPGLPDAADAPDAPDVPPDVPALPAALRGDTWLAHHRDDVLPFWTQSAALGTPAGNFPTWRGMDGAPRPPDTRRPRMIGRQVYAYALGYALTGDAALLGHAKAGVDWLLAHAKDAQHGGWHALLDASGAPSGQGPRTAQDVSYVALGLAAWVFVTRDPAVEAEVLAVRDLLFDPAGYWDAANGRIRDAVDAATGTQEVDVDEPGWELVAQLDPVNAFLLLTQPILRDAGRRSQFLDDLRTLCTTLRDRFWSDGMFWGVAQAPGAFGTSHVDFGHTLKAFWMIRTVDGRLADRPFRAFVEAEAPAVVDRAWDAANGRWAKRPTGPSSIEYGSDWWAYAEADQLAAAMDLEDHRYDDRLAASGAHWLTDYVDRTRPAREVVPSVDRMGAWVWGWSDADTAKCNEWKNGYHTTEHALVMYLAGRAHEGRDADLHFAVPPAEAGTFAATPYVFQGTETGRETLGTTQAGGTTLARVRVSFRDLR